jgi:Holliday junction resolvase RusA-like endonuclease
MFPFKIVLKGQPISTNHIYLISCRGGYPQKYLSKQASILKEDYQWQGKIQWRGKKMLKDRLFLDIKIYLKNKRIIDWDNLHKLSMDSLNKIIWEDDKQIHKATVERLYNKKYPRIEIIINKYEL